MTTRVNPINAVALKCQTLRLLDVVYICVGATLSGESTGVDTILDTNCTILTPIRRPAIADLIERIFQNQNFFQNIVIAI